jgi:hypothetical protein
MKSARIVFAVAALYGMSVTVPLYFSEQALAVQYPPPLAHPEYYYSFAGVTLVWQILFVLIAVAPDRLRPAILACVLEKLSLLPTFFILNPQGRFPQLWVPLVIIDILFAVLFLVAFFKARKSAESPIAARSEQSAEDAAGSPE